MIRTTALDSIGSALSISNGEVELVATTSVGPRILFYRFVHGENILGLWPSASQTNDLGTWKPYGGHRIWAAPEEQPRTYYPDNDPVTVKQLTDRAVQLTASVERVTNIQKELRITLLEGASVALEHLITNCGDGPTELAPWSLTIMRPGGTTIIPQEPYRSHDDYLLPARPIVLWHFTDLTDKRFSIGERLIELRTDTNSNEPQKIGAMNKQGWAAYYWKDLLFVKEFDYRAGQPYPDYGANCEAYTQGDFMELESLGPMEVLAPGEAAHHTERWHLFRGVELSKNEEERYDAIVMLLSGK